MWLTNIIFENRVIENERIELHDKDALYFLGHELTLRHCSLSLRAPAKRLHVNKTLFEDCDIVAERVLKNFQWSHAHLKGCRFKGKFIGNDFGELPHSPGEGSIEDCDFTEAELHQTRFLGCDARTLRFPPWPCFTLFDPVRRAPELSVLPWPGEKGHIIAELFAEDPPSTVALTYQAVEFAKSCCTTPEAVKALVAKLDGVYY
jgi:hypothetical protein